METPTTPPLKLPSILVGGLLTGVLMFIAGVVIVLLQLAQAPSGGLVNPFQLSSAAASCLLVLLSGFSAVWHFARSYENPSLRALEAVAMGIGAGFLAVLLSAALNWLWQTLDPNIPMRLKEHLIESVELNERIPEEQKEQIIAGIERQFAQQRRLSGLAQSVFFAGIFGMIGGIFGALLGRAVLLKPAEPDA
ncbi:MAG: DUF4199 family protein [Bacteroidetes bacterium]|nr:DUF4199 family protein [Rhodothermia bacterium]MCS7155271.1 DUF4199 family protein [Bacteroidota bacterium]MCX7907856.1 DUF4199 family protein [Bacteroidota bacterium]MDW8138675.1 DUF4199 family protein [Bacteroidota bacterium]MDW8284739.1 DUF4199 family protein [Bacteroidota bacterium]